MEDGWKFNHSVIVDDLESKLSYNLGGTVWGQDLLQLKNQSENHLAKVEGDSLVKKDKDIVSDWFNINAQIGLDADDEHILIQYGNIFLSFNTQTKELKKCN